MFQSRECATCTFAEGSTAIGCHIRFVDTTGNTTAKEINAPRPDWALLTIGCVEDLPPGVYRVTAHDIVSGGGTDNRVAAVGESLVTVTASTTGIYCMQCCNIVLTNWFNYRDTCINYNDGWYHKGYTSSRHDTATITDGYSDRDQCTDSNGCHDLYGGLSSTLQS